MSEITVEGLRAWADIYLNAGQHAPRAGARLAGAADRIEELEAVLRVVVRADLDQSGVFWQDMAGWLDLTESQTQLVTDVLAADGGGS